MRRASNGRPWRRPRGTRRGDWDPDDLARQAARAAHTPGGRAWLQVNCTLFPQAPDGALYVPWATLQTALETWRAEGRFARCFFMRKPPGLRLRFQGGDLDARLVPALVAWLEAAERRNDLRGFRFARYEPERFRFGGPAGMDLAHEQFDRDSRLALRYETLPAAAREALPRDLYSVIVTQNLIGRCVEDGAEAWDVWQRLALAVGGEPPLPHDAGAEARDRAALIWAPAFAATLPPDARALVEAARADNAAIAARLHAASVARPLTVGPRAWLAAATVFHWNRLGLALPELRALMACVLALLDDA